MLFRHAIATYLDQKTRYYMSTSENAGELEHVKKMSCKDFIAYINNRVDEQLREIKKNKA